MPETLLKKRKSQEKQREARAAELTKKRKVCSSLFCVVGVRLDDGDDIYHITRLVLRVDVAALLTIFRG